MNKVFIPFDQIRNNALKLAYEVYNTGFIPDVIYIPLRGGAYMGNVFSEFFKIVRNGERPVFYAAVVARSYTDIHQQDRVMIDGWTYNPEHLRHGDKILFIDDIFDSGKTLNHLVEVILEKGIPRSDVKVAVHDYKDVKYKEHLPIQPDFYCNKYEIEKVDDEMWIHYMSHELIGLTKEEQQHQYLDKEPGLQHIFDFINKQK
jgi:hypoxanthine phosphoribosyltransferase